MSGSVISDLLRDRAHDAEGDKLLSEAADLVDTLRAQLEAAEADCRRTAEIWTEFQAEASRQCARAEAAEADAARWRGWRELDEHAAADIAWTGGDANGRDAAIDAAIARTKEEAIHAGEA